jgi:hypothetical protein
VLAESASVRGLGRRDLRDGETYTIEVMSLGRLITGRVTIPHRAELRLVENPDGTRVVVWPRIASAAAYVAEFGFSVFPVPTPDTTYVLPPYSGDATFQVTVVDPNWLAYIRDHRTLVAGLQGGYGVFGAANRTTIALPTP